MKKLLFITIFIVVAILGAWYFFKRGDIPIVNTIKTGPPFGSGDGINIPPNLPRDTTESTPTLDATSTKQKLFRISNAPVAGFVTLSKEGATAIRYAERATGHIFDMIIPSATSSNPIEKVRITNTTIPKIYEAVFRTNGGAVLYRSIDENGVVENISITLIPPKATSTETFYSISSVNLRGDIDSVVAGAGDTLLYVLKDADSIVSSTFTGSGAKTLFSSGFNNWRIGKLGNNPLIYTKAGVSMPGFAYSLSGNTLTKILGPLNALVAIGSPDGKKIAYSYIDRNGKTRFSIKNVGQNTPREISPATIAEKCVWSVKSPAIMYCGTPTQNIGRGEPDSWYQGKTHFSDYLWSFNTNSELSQLILEPEVEFGIELDVSEPQLSPDESLFIFINKFDQTLWGVRI